MPTRFSFSMFILLIPLLAAMAPPCNKALEIHCKSTFGPVIKCRGKDMSHCQELELDILSLLQYEPPIWICESYAISDMKVVQETCVDQEDPDITFQISYDHWKHYLNTKGPLPNPFPECSKELIIHCEDTRKIGPVISCKTDVATECIKYELGTVLRPEQSGYAEYVCRVSTLKVHEGILTDIKYVEEACIDPEEFFEISSDDWLRYLADRKELEARKLEREREEHKLRQEELKKEKEKKKKETWTTKKERAAEYATKTKKKHVISWYSRYYKSEQGSKGDCVMHSLNNILRGPYITNYVMGFTFGIRNRLNALPVTPATTKEARKKAWRTGEYDFMAICDKKENVRYYEAFRHSVVEKALATFNAKETELEIAGKKIDFFEHGSEALAKALEGLRYDPSIGPRLIGLRFIYKSSLDGRHSIGIYYLDRRARKTGKKVKGGKHWGFVQSWRTVRPLEFTDLELAEHLYEGSVHMKEYEWTKKLYVVTVLPEAALLPVPRRDIRSSDELLDRYYHCVQQLKRTKEERLEEYEFGLITECEARVDLYKIKEEEKDKRRKKRGKKRGKKATTDYENYFYNDYDDDMDISYNDMDTSYNDDELDEMREMSRLKQLRDREQYQTNGLLRQYYSRNNRLDVDDSIEDNYY